VAQGLAAAHAHGVVHRDVKPSNIMVLGGRHAKIMDFGVARMQSSEVRTRSGVLLGSPKYMSPEQVSGHAVDARSDIFSLGSMLYEMVAGAPAFGGAELGNLLYDILHTTPAMPSRLQPQVPQLLDLVLARAMQKNPAARYQDARALADDLQACRAELMAALAPANATQPPARTAAPYAATVRTDAPAPPAGGMAGMALLPSLQFDSAAALQGLLAAAGRGEAAAGQGPGLLRRLGWPLVYAAAFAGALAIALA
jgi:serine/threonine-protein kinase